MNTASNSAEVLLRESDVARILGLSLAAIRRWRVSGKGPKFLKVGGATVRYRRSDLERWLAAQPTGGDASTLAEAKSIEPWEAR